MSIPLCPPCRACQKSLPYQGAPHIGTCRYAAGYIPRDSVERMVYRLYAEYPSLFGRSPWSRWYIFGHLFFTNGNGLDWHRGKLVDVVEKEKPIGQVRIKTGADEVAELERWRKERGFDSDGGTTAADIERRWVAEHNRRPQYFYPLCEYADIVTVPDGVLPTWLAACWDALKMLEAVPASSRTEMNGNAKWTARVRENLTRRFL